MSDGPAVSMDTFETGRQLHALGEYLILEQIEEPRSDLLGTEDLKSEALRRGRVVHAGSQPDAYSSHSIQKGDVVHYVWRVSHTLSFARKNFIVVHYKDVVCKETG